MTRCREGPGQSGVRFAKALDGFDHNGGRKRGSGTSRDWGWGICHRHSPASACGLKADEHPAPSLPTLLRCDAGCRPGSVSESRACVSDGCIHSAPLRDSSGRSPSRRRAGPRPRLAPGGPVTAPFPPPRLPSTSRGGRCPSGGASSIVVKRQRPGRGPEEHDLTCGKTAPAWKRGPTWSPFGVVTKDVAWGHRELSRCACTCEQVPEREAEHTAPYGWPGRGLRAGLTGASWATTVWRKSGCFGYLGAVLRPGSHLVAFQDRPNCFR